MRIAVTLIWIILIWAKTPLENFFGLPTQFRPLTEGLMLALGVVVIVLNARELARKRRANAAKK
jgi:hypothetical protein